MHSGEKYSMYKWSCLLSLFAYSSVAVFVVIVGGEQTAGVDDNDLVDDLIDSVAKLDAKVESLAAKVEGAKGVTYVRWGRLECDASHGAALLYNGYMTSHHSGLVGGGSNMLCLPQQPQWRNYTASDPNSGWLYGTAYYLGGIHASFLSTANTDGRPLTNHPVPCAVCYVPQRSASVMIPAALDCPLGWTPEYGGYLMSEHSLSGSNHPRHPTTYVCVDQAPEIATGGNEGQAWLVLVKVGCGVLPCSDFPNGRELVCIVCTK